MNIFKRFINWIRYRKMNKKAIKWSLKYPHTAVDAHIILQGYTDNPDDMKWE